MSTGTSHVGRHHPPGSAVARDVSVSVSAGGLRLEDAAGGVQVWPFAELVLVRGDHAGEPVQLERRADAVEVVIVEDRSLLAELRAQLPAGSRLAGSGTVVTARLLALIGIVLLALVFAAWRFGVPALADAAADRVPAEWEREFGAAIVDDFAPASRRERDPAVLAPAVALHERFAAVTAGDSRLVVARDDVVNAFAAPGGTVVVTTGLLRALRTSDELAAVLAHELGHVRRRHPIHGLVRQLSLQALVGLVAGDASVLSSGVRVAGQLGGLRYSRELENEADDDAVRLLANDGIRADALSRALESITRSAPQGALPGFLSTHPAPRERYRRIAAAAETLRPSEHALAVVDLGMWQAMKRALGAPDTTGARAAPDTGR